MPAFPRRLTTALALSFLALPAAVAQEPAADNPFAPGLAATLRDAAGHTAARTDPALAFHWPDAPPDPRLDAGPFEGTWRGRLLARDAGDHRFHLFGTGEVELTVAGKVVVPKQALANGWAESPPLPLPTEPVPFELSFRRTVPDARLMALWSGPRFGVEPIPARAFSHPRETSPGAEFDRGRLLAHALRCGQCHDGEPAARPAPALDRLPGSAARGWLAHWLADDQNAGDQASPRRMPAFGLTAEQAGAVADWLLSTGKPAAPPRPGPTLKEQRPPQEPAADRKKSAVKKPKPNAAAGEQLFLGLGCLACHTWKDLGAGGWFGGGDLSHVADKRPAGFFAAWLADPESLNRDHRMPVFALTADERTSLALFLAAQKTPDAKPDFRAKGGGETGGRLVAEFRCAACHRLPGESPAKTPPAPRLTERSDWQHACTGEPDAARHRPGYRLADADARALRAYFAARRPAPAGQKLDGRLLLAESNCLACHSRDGARESTPLLPPPLSDKLAAVAEGYPELAQQLPAMTPPTLTSVGDKLTDATLADVIARRGDPHRPYLRVRMPRFPLRDDELRALTGHLIDADRVPPRPPPPPPEPAARNRFTLAGGRLVSGDGFGCTSCHQVGSVLPSQAPVSARGPDLSRLDRRIRKEWFDRWVRDPARIVPRMEMPSVQIPVAGVLGDRLDDQIAAVWHVLNLPGFEPPQPNPVRTARQGGTDPAAEPVLVTDVLRRGKQTLTKPFLVGLANRHNVLLDLEAGGLAAWTVGDAARQRTEGKTWFWESAGTPVLDTGLTTPDLSLMAGGRERAAGLRGQFVTEIDAWQTAGPALELDYRLRFDPPADGKGGPAVTLRVRRKLTPLAAGFAEELTAGPAPVGAQVRLRVLAAAGKASLSPDGRTLALGDGFASRISLVEPADARFTPDRIGVLLTPGASGDVRAVLHYLSDVPTDRFPPVALPPAAPGKPVPIEVAPGFAADRLPLPAGIMPTGLAWRPNGRLVFSSLRGQVFEATDADGDGAEDTLTTLVDGLPAPYGVYAGADYVDVSAKYALLRVRGGRVETIASGWGYTPDYHDWAVGLPRTARGEYYLGIPCEQDKRSAAAAKLRGTVLRLVPRPPTSDDPRLFSLEPASAGHRFPMGLALDRRGELFVTDNQGNYNPFNELNHVRPGAHFGFVNSLDRGKPPPPLTPPAIDIPHPWTRSVNGICFLDTPPGPGRPAFGPFEGHLVGCEYDTRRLIRLSLQRVGDTYQGAAYPLSLPPDDPSRGLLGPLVCGVSPKGDLYVGGIRDSGWGAGNNVGEVVRVSLEPDRLPCGIAEVRAIPGGFAIDFVKPVDRALATRPDSYAVESYRRVSTPAYGGPDRDRRTEAVAAASVSADGRRVTLKLAELRPGFVYEFRLKNLTPGSGTFHPAEAHYTLRAVPR